MEQKNVSKRKSLWSGPKYIFGRCARYDEVLLVYDGEMRLKAKSAHNVMNDFMRAFVTHLCSVRQIEW